MPARVPVTAVLVAHDGSRWLPAALSALASSTVTPARVIAVDTGSTDDSGTLLRRALGDVLPLPRTTGHAAAVHAALAAVPAGTRWIWLLHDDCAPDPGTLSALLRAAAADPTAGILGPRVVDWDDPRVLVEMGCTTDASGARDPGAEAGEVDQGQHATPRRVLAVGTAGALIRRDVWDALGGLDPALPLFRDDVDLGWRANAAGHRVLVVPEARLRHARAATAGRRQVDCAAGSPAAVDRRAALQVLLAHTHRLPFLLLRVLLVCVLRSVGRLLVRQPGAARDELVALTALNPATLRPARRARAGTRTVPPAALRPLMASPWRRRRTRLTGWLERGRDRPVPALDEPAPSGGSRLRTHPGLALSLVLGALTLVAVRELLGRGSLAGGRLLSAPPGARDLWAAYADTRDPALALLAAGATALLGKADLAVEVLLLGAVPVSGAVAYAVTGRIVRSLPLRLWAAAAWALLPAASGAVAAGRLDAAAVHVALPALLLAGQRLAVRVAPWHRAFAFGLALTAIVAVAPVLWPLALVLLLGSALVRLAAVAAAQRQAAQDRALRAAVALSVPLALLLPWAPQLLDSRALLHGPGRIAPDLADPVLPAWHLLLLQPAGPGTPATLLTLGVLLAGLGGLLRTRRARVAASGWGLALLGLATALVLARTTADDVPVWPGVPLDLAAAGLLLAALVGGEGLQESLSRASFGARQLAAVGVVLLAAAVPLLCAADWARRGADGPLERTRDSALPAFAQAELTARTGTRALLLDPRPDGTVAYSVTGPAGPRLGDRRVEIDDVVADLLTARGAPAAEAAAAQGIAFVRASQELPALDAQPGLARQPGEVPLWRVVPPVRPGAPAPSSGLPLWLQAAAVLVVAVLAGPGTGPRRRQP